MRAVIGAALRRRRGPLVRFWSPDWELVHTEPPRLESWPHWARALPGRITALIRYRRHRRHVHVAMTAGQE